MKLYDDLSDEEADKSKANMMAYMAKVEQHLLTEMSLIKNWQGHVQQENQQVTA